MPPVSAIADVLRLWGVDGWLTPPLSPVVAAHAPVIGRVMTISIIAGAAGPGLAPLYSMLSRELSGRFVVIGGGTHVDGAVWGEIMATAAAANHAGGVLVDGLVRDVPTMAAIGLPTYASADCVVGPNGTAHAVEVGGTITIGGVSIDPLDSVAVDATGCVRIPHARLDEVLEASVRYAAAEDRVVQALTAGEPLTSAYLHKKTVVDELRR
ncbi:MAG: putative dimethylmenaquinone methyltransferase [Ilumatobacteraceae bacterium]|nr:putative dimethylmenaquinone methyltransferase [Ilumatobacteraceae bacterium]MCU1390119.1 putative dimethylmenaquinone methyltransferase [Ilumatobacteraceae bacterium]